MPTARKRTTTAAVTSSRDPVPKSARETEAPKIPAGGGKKLIVAEKPSVATDISRALGGFTKQGDYFESDEFVLSSAIGHLLEIAAPEEYEVKRGKWSFANLPVIPPHFDLRPIEKTADRLKLLTRLLKRKDVVGVINACDAGREGELIFRYIVQHAGSGKPVERLWLQSMTPSAIRDGFSQLRSGESMQPLADAAMCRSESDWLVGINGTRAMTAFNSKDGGFYKTTVGRVQTPTLAVLVERERRIKAFVSRNYWEVHATFGADAGDYAGRWFDEAFDKAKKADDADSRPERIWDEAHAMALAGRCEGKRGVVTEDAKPSTQAPPLLFDLTSLQREANGRFGFSAKTTLSIAQALYEKHKVLTYPRTDARALPEDYLPTVRQTLEMLRTDAPAVLGYGGLAGRVLRENWVKPNKRIFNNEKISDHFAIIPTLEAPRSLSEIELKLYDFVVRRFLSVFFPSAEYMITTRITRIGDDPFRTEGKVMVNAGWLEVYGKEAQDADATLAAVSGGEVDTLSVIAQPLATRPPARFNEATLLSAMEGAGKLVEDEDLRAAMSAKGLGTPATRAAVIEGLIFEEYLIREGRDLLPTAKAFDLFYALDKFGIDELRSPELTGTWEFKLKQMEQGLLGRPEFMRHITDTTQELVDRIKRGTLSDEPIATLAAPCPKCGHTVVENYRKFVCTNCDFSLWKVVAGRRMEANEIETLLTTRTIGPLQGFRSRMGRPFAAIIRLKDDFTPEFDFGNPTGDGNGDATPVDFSGQESLGPCPKCGSNVYEHGLSYVCDKAVGGERTCDFRSGRIILQRPIESEQMRKLLATGRTDLLSKFVSKKGRPFAAFLVRGEDGKVGFEFAPREVKAGKHPTKAVAKPSTAPPASPRAAKPKKSSAGG